MPGTNFLSNNRLSRAITQAAAAQTAVNGDSVDMQGFESLVALVALGAVAAGASGTVKFQHRNLATDNWADVANASVDFADDDDDGIVALACEHVRRRYMRVVVERASANSAIRYGIYVQTHPAKAAVSHADEVVAATAIT